MGEDDLDAMALEVISKGCRVMRALEATSPTRLGHSVGTIGDSPRGAASEL
jgi:hypothetical protein